MALRIDGLTPILHLVVVIVTAFSAPRAETETAAQRAARRLPLAPCKGPWGDEELLCGTYEVYENRELQSGRKIPIHVVVVPSLAENPDPDPIFDFDGGPGLPSTQAAGWYATDAPFRQKRDIVLIDLRGMGGSNPLHCDLLGDPLVLQNYLQDMYPTERVQACREELEKKADLSQYTTVHAMGDLEEIRAWLGYERINIVAVSYGGRAAYVYARAHPERVRTLILLGPATVDSKMPMYHAPLAERAFERLCADCAADSLCHAAFPGLERELRELVERLRHQPTETMYKHPQLPESTAVTVRAENFVESLRSQLYDAGSRSEVPFIVHHAYRGDFTPFLDIAIPSTLGSPPMLAEGAYLSITGAEDAPFIDQEEAEALARGTLLGDYRIAQQRRAAGLWPRGSVPADFLDKVRLDVPALVLQGELDPVIGEGGTAGYFRNGRELILPHSGHLPHDFDCVTAIMVPFLDSADPVAVDTSCLAAMAPLPFKVNAEEAE